MFLENTLCHNPVIRMHSMSINSAKTNFGNRVTKKFVPLMHASI